MMRRGCTQQTAMGCETLCAAPPVATSARRVRPSTFAASGGGARGTTWRADGVCDTM
jgi:hypothetical protein